MKLPPEPKRDTISVGDAKPTVEVDTSANEKKTVRVDTLNRTERQTIKLPPRGTNSFVKDEPAEGITLDTLIKAREGGRAAAKEEERTLIRAWWAGVTTGAMAAVLVIAAGVALTGAAIKWGATGAAALWHWVKSW